METAVDSIGGDGPDRGALDYGFDDNCSLSLAVTQYAGRENNIRRMLRSLDSGSARVEVIKIPLQTGNTAKVASHLLERRDRVFSKLAPSYSTLRPGSQYYPIFLPTELLCIPCKTSSKLPIILHRRVYRHLTTNSNVLISFRRPEICAGEIYAGST